MGLGGGRGEKVHGAPKRERGGKRAAGVVVERGVESVLAKIGPWGLGSSVPCV